LIKFVQPLFLGQLVFYLLEMIFASICGTYINLFAPCFPALADADLFFRCELRGLRRFVTANDLVNGVRAVAVLTCQIAAICKGAEIINALVDISAPSP
jgi:hypothetical protein